MGESARGCDLSYWYNGQYYSGDTLSLDIRNPALLYGATVFTTLRVYDYCLTHPETAWDAHCDRLLQSLRHFQWSEPDWAQVRAGADRLALDFPVLRVTLFPDGQELILGRSLPEDLLQRQQQGIAVWIADASYQRSLPAHKTGNYLACRQILQLAKTQGAEEAVLISSQGHWLETSTGNLWGWTQNTWWTPPLNGSILPGVMRSQLLQRLRRQGRRVCQQPWTPDVARQFETLAYSNAVVRWLPIHTVVSGQIRLSYDPSHPVLRELNGKSLG